MPLVAFRTSINNSILNACVIRLYSVVVHQRCVVNKLSIIQYYVAIVTFIIMFSNIFTFFYNHVIAFLLLFPSMRKKKRKVTRDAAGKGNARACPVETYKIAHKISQPFIHCEFILQE